MQIDFLIRRSLDYGDEKMRRFLQQYSGNAYSLKTFPLLRLLLYHRAMTSKNTAVPLKIFKLMWGALLASQFVYAFVLFNVAVKKADLPVTPRWLPNFQNPFESAILTMAVGSATLAFFIPRLIAKSAKTNASESGAREESLSANLFAAFLVRLAIVESICLFGFMLGMTAKTPTLIVPFLAASALIYLKNFPSDSRKVEGDLGL